jgi:hypothetical protein
VFDEKFTSEPAPMLLALPLGASVFATTVLLADVIPMGPVKVFSPLRVKLPPPAFVRPNEPPDSLITPLSVRWWSICVVLVPVVAVVTVRVAFSTMSLEMLSRIVTGPPEVTAAAVDVMLPPKTKLAPEIENAAVAPTA